MVAILALAALLAGDPTGQVAKFETRPPDGQYVSNAAIGDVERCLIRTGSPPQVYRQPDRPDDVTMVWTSAGVSAGNAAARVDLRKIAAGTLIRSWLSMKLVRACAP